MRPLVTLIAVAALAATVLLLPASAASAPSPQVRAEPRADVAPPRGPSMSNVAPEPDRDRTLPPNLTPTLVDACLEVAEQIDPQLAQRLRHLCAEDQDAFERVMRTYGRRLVGLVELRDRDPELYESKLNELRNEAQVRNVVKELHEAQQQGSAGKVEELTARLRVHLQVQVAYSFKARGDYIRRLEQHVEALRSELERDVSRFDETVDRRLKKYLESTTTDRDILLEDSP